MLADLARSRRQRRLQDTRSQLGPDGARPLAGQDLDLRGVQVCLAGKRGIQRR